MKPVFCNVKSEGPLNCPKNIGDCMGIPDGSNDTSVDPRLFWLYNNRFLCRTRHGKTRTIPLHPNVGVRITVTVFRAGAGSAGAVVANRLTENPNWKASADYILHRIHAFFIRIMLMLI